MRVLIALDFPALDRPAKATSKPVSAGHWFTLAALMAYLALLYTGFLGSSVIFKLSYR